MPNTAKFNARPVWKMADKMCGGQLADIIRFERARGQSYDSITRFLAANYGVEIVRQTTMKWCHEIAKADKEGRKL
jgi:hypothetical protein